MNIINIDNNLPLDDCPAIHYVPPIQRFGFLTNFKHALKIWIYCRLSGRPKRGIPQIPENPRCVLVATGGNLGGAIISLPLIEGVRKRWPNAHLAVVSNQQHGLDIVKRAGVGDSFHLAPKVSLKNMFFSASYWSFRKEICLFSPNIYISNFNFGLDHTLPLRSINLTVGQLFGSNRVLDSCNQNGIFDIYSVMEPDVNWLEGYWGILSKLNVDVRLKPFIHVSEAQRLAARRSLESFGVGFDDAVVGVQASVWGKQLFKAWPVRQMAELCEQLWSQHNIRVLIIGARGQKDLGDYLRQHYPDVLFIDGVGKFGIEELPNVVATCAAVVTNDSGLMHLSAAVGTPTLAIYGMTDPKITWVYGDDNRHRIVRRAGCKPCYVWDSGLAETCPTRHCLDHLAPKTILNALLNMLQNSAHKKSFES